jgi:tetratricopeptide (TPR) repeat protein
LVNKENTGILRELSTLRSQKADFSSEEDRRIDPESFEEPISYLRYAAMAMSVVLISVSLGSFFGFRNLQQEEMKNLLDQAKYSLALDTFAGYGDAKRALMRILEMDEEHLHARALLALVSSRIHDDYGPNLSMKSQAKRFLANAIPGWGEKYPLEYFWTRFHLTEDYSKLIHDIGNVSKGSNEILLELVGEIGLAQKKNEFAKEWLEASLSMAPKNPRVLFYLGTMARSAGDLEQAENFFSRALGVNSQHVQSILSLAELRLKRTSKLDSIKLALEKVIRLLDVKAQDKAHALRLKAEIAFLAGQRTKAVSLLQTAGELSTGNVEQLLAIARLCKEHYELDFAEKLTEKALLLDKNVRSELFSISLEIPRGRSRKALLRLEGLIGKTVPTSEFLLLRGKAFLGQQRYSEAINDFVKVSPESSMHFTAGAWHALALIGLEQITSAGKVLSSLSKDHSDKALYHYVRGQLNKAKGRHKAAASAFRSAIKMDPSFYLAYEQLAWQDYSARRLKQAEKMVDLALAINPYHLDSCYLRGLVYQKNNNHKSALNLFARVVVEQPESGRAFLKMAESLLELGEYKKADIAIKKAEKAGETSAPAKLIKGKIYLGTKRFRSALKALSLAEQEDQGNSEILAALGLAYLKLNLLEKSEKAFQDSLSKSKRGNWLPEVYQGLAMVLERRHEWKKSALAYEKAARHTLRIAKDPKQAAELFIKSGLTGIKDSSAGKKRFAQARRRYRWAAKQSSENPQPRYLMGLSFEQEDNTNAARQEYQKALKINADHLDSLYQLGLLELKENQHQGAKELLHRYLELNPKGKKARTIRKTLLRIE